MKSEQVTTTLGANEEKGRPEELRVTVEFPKVPESLDDAVELYGEAVTFSLFEYGYSVKRHNAMRAQMAKKSTEEVQEWANRWEPGLAPKRMSEEEKTAKKVKNMSPEQKARFKELLQKELGL